MQANSLNLTGGQIFYIQKEDGSFYIKPVKAPSRPLPKFNPKKFTDGLMEVVKGIRAAEARRIINDANLR